MHLHGAEAGAGEAARQTALESNLPFNNQLSLINCTPKNQPTGTEQVAGQGWNGTGRDGREWGCAISITSYDSD